MGLKAEGEESTEQLITEPTKSGAGRVIYYNTAVLEGRWRKTRRGEGENQHSSLYMLAQNTLHKHRLRTLFQTSRHTSRLVKTEV